MATFEAQVEGLTSLSIDGSSAPTQTELTQFLTDGAKEIINVLPSDKLDWCSSQQTFTSVMPGSEAETLNTGKVLRVYRNDGDFDRICRRILPDLKGYVVDPDEMDYASVTDPVYYTENNKINVLPEGGSCKYDEVQYPAVAYGDSSISVFPDEAEYLVVLYGAIKSLQNVLGNKTSNAAITTATTAMKTELNETQAICDLINTQVDSAVTNISSALTEIGLSNTEVDKMAAEVTLDNGEIDKATAELAEAVTLVDSSVDTATAAITTAASRINTAAVLANTQFDSAVTANTNEDTELASSHISAGQGFISEASSSSGEVSAYVSEVSARINQVQAQVGIAQGYISSGSGYSRVADGYGKVANGYLGTAKDYLQAAQSYVSAAQGYANEIQSKISISQGYSNEVQARLAVDTAHYTWYEKQQAKLQADYESGTQKFLSGYKN